MSGTTHCKQNKNNENEQTKDRLGKANKTEGKQREHINAEMS